MEAHRRRNGHRLTYDDLAVATGLSRSTIETIGSRQGYNARLSTIDKLCEVLDCNVSDLLERLPKEHAVATNKKNPREE